MSRAQFVKTLYTDGVSALCSSIAKGSNSFMSSFADVFIVVGETFKW